MYNKVLEVPVTTPERVDLQSKFEEGVKKLQKQQEFKEELERLINRYSLENESNTPDYILSDYLYSCLEVLHETINQRDTWWRNKSSVNKNREISISTNTREQDETPGE